MKMPAMSVRLVVGGDVAAEDQRVDQRWPAPASSAYLRNSVASTLRRGAAVEILVRDRDERLR